MKKLILLSSLLLAGLTFCQDEDYTEPKDTASGTPEEAADYSNGDYEGLPAILSAGQIFDGFDFDSTHSKTDWLDAEGNQFSLGISSSEAARLDLLGDDTFTVTLPAVSPGDEDVTFNFDVSTPGGYADAGYQVARAFVDDLDGDGIDDTVAYAAVIVPAVSAESAPVLGGLLIGSNSDLFGSTEFLGAGVATPSQIASKAIGTFLKGKPAIVFARKLILSSEAESDSGARTDSGFSAQLVPLGLVGGTSSAVLGNDADDSSTAGTFDDMSLAYIACLGHGGTALPTGSSPASGDCNTTGATPDATTAAKHVLQADGFGSAISGSVSAFTSSGGSGMYTAAALANGLTTEDAITHKVKVEFNYQGGGLGRIQVSFFDEDGVSIGDATSTDFHNFTLQELEPFANTDADALIDLTSQTAQKGACGQDDEVNDLLVDPAVFKNYNVFGNTDSVCAEQTKVGTILTSDSLAGMSLYSLLSEAEYTGYAISLGNVVAAALAEDNEADAAEVFGTVVAKNGLKSVTISNLKIKAYND